MFEFSIEAIAFRRRIFMSHAMKMAVGGIHRQLYMWKMRLMMESQSWT